MSFVMDNDFSNFLFSCNLYQDFIRKNGDFYPTRTAPPTAEKREVNPNVKNSRVVKLEGF